MKRTVVFDELANSFASHLVGNGGLLVADDFNQRALQFNDACMLGDAITARRLPEAYGMLLNRSYARRLIREGQPLRVADEVSWIATLPAEAKVEAIPEAGSAPELFGARYPETANLLPAQRKLAFERFHADARQISNGTTPGSEVLNWRSKVEE
jgi:hypothetical protein